MSIYTDAFLEKAGKHSNANRFELHASNHCACYFCMTYFDVVYIKEWSEDTAFCPSCGVDAVIGTASGYVLDSAFLKAMNEHWFGVGSLKMNPIDAKGHYNGPNPGGGKLERKSDFDEYQDWAETIAVYPAVRSNLEYTVLGLCGEAGELANKVKKLQRDGWKPTSREDMLKELGGVLWYVAAVAWELQCSLSKVAQDNQDALNSRLARGTIHGDGDNR